MLPFWFIFVAATMRLAGGLAYLRATLTGEARPNPLSWLLWGVTPLIAFAAEVNAGVGLTSIVTLALGVSPLMVFVATMIKNPSSFKLDGFNLSCALIAITGIVLWRTTSHPELAIALAIMADVVSAMPTIRKTIHDPYSEYTPTYFISASSMALTLLTIQSWSFATFAFPLYIFIVNSFMVWLITTGRLLRKQRKPRRRKSKSKTRQHKR